MKKKNVVLIIAHDLGQHISPYGVQTVQTPNLERMAAEGALFEKNFCTSPGCSPSRAAIMTGRYPHSNGVMGLTHDDFLWRFNEGETHLAQKLQDNGYRTCVLGNWHENNRIDNVGYQATVTRDESGLALCDDVNQNTWHPHALDLAERAGFYFEQAKEQAEPFYLYVGIFEPHRPFNYEGCTPDTEKGVWIPPYIPQETPAQKAAADEEFGAMQGCIKRMDEAVGKILDRLDELGMKDDTVVLFTSDHGLAMPRAKCTLYDPGTETPLMLWGAGMPENKRFSNLVSNVDYFPTLLDALDIPVPDNVQGRSLMPLLTGDEVEAATAVFAEKNYHRDYDPIRSIRTERWKFIINFEFNMVYDCPADIQMGAIFLSSVEEYMGCRDRMELYDLDADPWEQSNLAKDPAYAEIKQELQEQLLGWMKETDDPLLDGPVRSIYNREIFKDLGCE